MNTEDLVRLARRADDITGRGEDRLSEVHARIHRARRRRVTGAAFAAVALVAVVAVGVSALTSSTNPRPEPAPTPKPDRPAPASVRALTWTDEFWPSRRIHYGNQLLDTHLDLTAHDFTQMDLTDDGVVITTTDGRIWFADTNSVEPIGDSGITHTFLSLFRVSTGNLGSLAAWPELEGNTTTLVVYDTAARRQVARTRCHKNCDVLWVGPESVYLGRTDRSVGDRVRRVETSGRVTSVSESAYLADLRTQPRNLIVGDAFDTGAVSDGIDTLFIRQGSRLLATRPDEFGGGLASAFDILGAPLRFRVPDGYDGARSFTVFQWLDDDRLALMAGAGGTYVPGLDTDQTIDNTGYGDILVCHISTGACRLAVPGPPVSDPASDEDISPRIVPDYGTPGTN